MEVEEDKVSNVSQLCISSWRIGRGSQCQLVKLWRVKEVLDNYGEHTGFSLMGLATDA